MSHSYRSHYFHIVWSTKEKRKFIDADIKNRLYHYICGIAKNNGGDVLQIGGIEDHLHLLLELKNPDKFTQIIRNMKSYSSLWIHKTFPQYRRFSWQEGYGSFSVNYGGLEQVRNYIANQEEHHKVRTFEEEFNLLLKKHGIEIWRPKESVAPSGL
jgi:putative transposase